MDGSDHTSKGERIMDQVETGRKGGKMRRFLGRVHRALTDSRGLINTTDLLVAAGATVILSAGVTAASMDTLNLAKYGKAQPDGTAIAQAIAAFAKDTGKWPGQAEQAGTTTVLLLATGPYGAVTFPLPDVAGIADVVSGGAVTTIGAKGLAQGGANCANNSLEGFVSRSIAPVPSSALSARLDAQAVTVRNLNDYLVRNPATAAYPNWKGPYVQEVTTDPWGKSWVAYLAPLYCSENLASFVNSDKAATGNLGYAWLFSGGSNGTITTPATATNLDPTGDDAGAILGKLIVRSSPTS